MRVLIVEDEARIAELVKGALADAEFVADTVATVADARAALAVAPYDAIILDLGLPDEDGTALLGGLRAAGNQTPILVLTARDTVEDRVCGLDAGADDYPRCLYGLDHQIIECARSIPGRSHDGQRA